MQETKEGEAKKKKSGLVINWKRFIDAYKREKPKFDEFIKKALEEKRILKRKEVLT